MAAENDSAAPGTPNELSSRRRLIGDTAAMLSAFGLRAMLQALFFIVVARSLGVSAYGTFMAAAALSAIAAPFSGIGSGNLLIKHVANDRSAFAIRWGDVIARTVISSVVLLLLLMGVAAVSTGRRLSLELVAYVGVADLLFARLLEACGQAYQGLGRLQRTAQVQVVPNVAKLVAALLLACLVAHPTARDWAVLYLASSAITGIGALHFVRRELGTPQVSLRRTWSDFAEGIHFSISQAAQNVYNDLDKTMLASMSTPAAVGIYAAAYRLLDVSFTPVRSILFASYANFFRAGVSGLSGSVRQARKLLPFAAAAGLCASLALYFGAPIIPRILGRDYAEAVSAIRWLSPIPLIRSFHYMAADSLTGAGYQSIRSRVQVLIAVANFLLNLVLIPTYSWVGAAWVSVACDAGLAVCLWGCVLALLRRQRQSPSVVAARL